MDMTLQEVKGLKLETEKKIAELLGYLALKTGCSINVMHFTASQVIGIRSPEYFVRLEVTL